MTHQWQPGEVFVFGSNLAGAHGAGAARDAFLYYGAQYGVGVGMQGESYAIPTKDQLIRTRSLEEIQGSVDVFKKFAQQNPAMTFFLTRIGCGLAGYADADISPMFADAPDNVRKPEGW